MILQTENLDLKKIRVGAMPFVDQTLEILDFTKTLESFVKNNRYANVIAVLLKSILLEPAALYRIPEWAAQYDLAVFGDDVIGRALDKLFKCDRASLQTKLALKAISTCNVDTSIIHNDSTTVKFYGAYQGQCLKSVKLKRGHSKDHRPDLKQLVYNLSITEDGAVPVHFKCHDGNVTDDTLHKETWLTLRGMLGYSDFLYVADSKLCTSSNMNKIDREGGRFVTIVPDTRSETKEFAEQCYRSEVRWQMLARRPSTRRQNAFNVFQVAADFYQLSEGYRLYWYRSSEKRVRDEESRKDRIESAQEKLAGLVSEQRRGPRTEDSMKKKVLAILTRYQVKDWIGVDIKVRQKDLFVKSTVGKPGPDSIYRKKTRNEPYLIVSLKDDAMAKSAATDGIFPLTTNAKLDAKQVLEAYKYQPYLEKRFSWAKSDYEIAPAFLKKTDRIESLMFVHYMADLVAALIQRKLRQAMESNKIEFLQTLPEDRKSKTPTWEQIQRLFDQQARYELRDQQVIIKAFSDPLTKHQLQVINLTGISESVYKT